MRRYSAHCGRADDRLQELAVVFRDSDGGNDRAAHGCRREFAINVVVNDGGNRAFSCHQSDLVRERAGALSLCAGGAAALYESDLAAHRIRHLIGRIGEAAEDIVVRDVRGERR